MRFERIGCYDVTALIGEGGMGQVYQATDTKLKRQVALKILPEAFAADPERLARFQREAEVLASLNHPNIAAIHGLEEADGIRALVLELVEGPTLADRIKQGPIPLDEALLIAKQIAEALEAAHEKGIIHRDLKPANIKVKADGTVKVLDFGLAKALDPNPTGDPSQSPTLTAMATQMGVIMGTAAYMSPEQARGTTVDKRADIWAFGCVLFEMLTGKKAFPGDDLTDTIAAVVRGEPAWEVLPDDVPARLTQILRACLEKDKTLRVRDVGDVTLAMEGRFETTVSVSQVGVLQAAGWRQALPWAVGIALAIVTGVAVWSLTRPAAAPLSRFTVAPRPGVEATGVVRFSPDGRTLAFQGLSEGLSQVYLRRLDQLEAVPLPGTEGSAPVSFSPDGASILVQAVSLSGTILFDGTLKRVGGGGANWGPEDTVVMGGGPPDCGFSAAWTER